MFAAEKSETQTDLCFWKNRLPGSVVVGLKIAEAGFSGVRGLREGLAEDGSRGTVGKPGGQTFHNE